MICSQPEPSQPTLERLANYLDCHAQTLGQTGFASFSQWMAPLLGGCLVIYVALIGYRLLLGRPYGPREALLSVIRAAVVIAFVTGWPAYEAVAYRVVIDGPAEVAAQLSPGTVAASLPQAARRLDADFQALRDRSAANLAQPAPLSSNTSGQAAQSAAAPSTPSPPTSRDPARGLGGQLVVLFTVGGLAAAQVSAGLLLGLGPLFVVLALFDVALGVFEGWVRGLAAVFVGSVGATVVTALELDFIETQLLQPGPVFDTPDTAGEPALILTALLFGAAMVAVAGLAIVVGRAFRLPLFRPLAVSSIGAAPASWRDEARARPAARPEAQETASRALGVADAVRRLGRREAVHGIAAGPNSDFALQARALVGGPPSMTSPGAPGASGGAPFRRRTPPQTASVERRDRLQ
jgi:type IV secretion system protein VirB6